MKRKWIVLSLITGLIMLTGVLLYDAYRTMSGRAGQAKGLSEQNSFMPADLIAENKDPEDGTETKDHTEREEETETNETAKEVLSVPDDVNVVIFGDILLHENALANANRYAGGTGAREDWNRGFDIKPMFQSISREIGEADLAMVTQASLLGANGAEESLSGYPTFNGPVSVIDDLKEMGFDAVNCATNHALDLGKAGWDNSVKAWREKDLHAIGMADGTENPNAPERCVIECGGLRIALLSYVSTTNVKISSSAQISVPYYTVNDTAIRRKMLEDDVAACKNAADAVIVFVNFGSDTGFDISSLQEDTVRILAEAGADVIVGNGPKVLQPVQWITRANGKKTLCAYSLGNSICTMQYIENLLGGYLRFTLEKKGGEVAIKDALFVPTVVVYDEKIDHLRLEKLADYTEDRFLEHGSNILYGRGEYAWLNAMVRKQSDPSLLPASFR
ncbi:MAG: CapA family protein [Clostridia bacterium]|nr:CapA family protein [Clostridia bacterium]